MSEKNKISSSKKTTKENNKRPSGTSKISKNRNDTKIKNNKSKYKNRKRQSNKILSFLLNISLIVAVCYAGFLTLKIIFPVKDYDIIQTYSELNDLDEALVCAIINVESGFDPMAVSNKGASGYMQIMEGTALWGIETLDIEGVSYEDIFSPELNIALGTWYLSNLCKQFGSEDLAIISYNAGSGNVSKWLLEHEGDEEATLADIPFKETKNYYFKVKSNEYAYRFMLKYIYKYEN